MAALPVCRTLDLKLDASDLAVGHPRAGTIGIALCVTWASAQAACHTMVSQSALNRSDVQQKRSPSALSSHRRWHCGERSADHGEDVARRGAICHARSGGTG